MLNFCLGIHAPSRESLKSPNKYANLCANIHGAGVLTGPDQF